MKNPISFIAAIFYSLVGVFFALVFLGVGNQVSAQEAPNKNIRIGLRAYISIEAALDKWQPTADYLSEKIPGYTFELVPYAKINELTEAAGRNEFDFLLTNPSSYIDIELLYGGSRILTLKNKRRGKGYTQFGSVIFSLANRADINSLADIKNKTLIAVSPPAFGGWRMAWLELLESGVNPHADLKKLMFAGGSQVNVVDAIMNKKADVGIVRTDTLERFHAKGKINLADFKVLGAKIDPEFPFLRSTRLYPEWPFVQMKTSSLDLAEKISAILLQMPENHPAALGGQYVGWSVPLNYAPVHDLLKQLKVGPYKNYGELTIRQLFDKYWHWIIAISAFICVLLVVTSYALRVNLKLRKAKNQLKRNKVNLEKKVLEHVERLSQTNTHFRTIVSSIADGVVTVDAHRTIVTMNPAIKKIFDYDRMELLQDKITTIIPGLYVSHEREIPLELNTTIELEGRKKNNSTFPVEVKFTETELEGLQMFVGVIRDISTRKHHERMKDEFISTVSHELRTPLTSLNGSLKLVLGGAVGEISPSVNSLIELASRNSERLLTLISDILDFNKIESGLMSFELQPVNVAHMLDTAIKLNSGYAEKHHVILELEEINEPLTIRVDENRIQQVMSNLLSNAVKFSQSGSVVKLSVKKIVDRVRISVIDCGKGIANEFHRNIFERFTQVDSSDSRVAGGTGLGLNISKIIIENHGGKISCISEVGKGSTFYFDLPEAEPVSTNKENPTSYG